MSVGVVWSQLRVLYNLTNVVLLLCCESSGKLPKQRETHRPTTLYANRVQVIDEAPIGRGTALFG